MASKISVILALIFWLLSFFLPVYDEHIGITLIIHALVMHIFIIPIFCAFPVWANLTFIKTLIYYINSKNKNESEEKLKEYSLLTLTLMFFGILIIFLIQKKIEVKIGGIVWFFSSLLLVNGVFLRKIKDFHAFMVLLVLLGFLGYIFFIIYEHSITQYKYNDKLYKRHDLKVSIFNKSESNLEIPAITLVKQNKEKWNKEGFFITQSKDERDLFFKRGDIIELDFNENTSNIYQNIENPVCKLGTNQQFSLIVPPRYLENGYIWKKYINFAIGVPSSLNSDYLYRASNIDDRHTKIEIIRKLDGEKLYEQYLVTYGKNYTCFYGPIGYQQELYSAFILPYENDDEIFQHSFRIKGKFNKKEILENSCIGKKEEQFSFDFEGKKIKFYNDKIAQIKMLCSDSYVAVLYLEYSSYQKLDNHVKLYVLDRMTLEPIECGSLLFPFEKDYIEKIYLQGITYKSVSILDKNNSSDCPSIKIVFSDLLESTKHNYLANYH